MYEKDEKCNCSSFDLCSGTGKRGDPVGGRRQGGGSAAEGGRRRKYRIPADRTFLYWRTASGDAAGHAG